MTTGTTADTAMTLGGRTALVTRAFRGLGRAIALRLARTGAAVGVGCREQQEAAEAVAKEIRARGGRRPYGLHWASLRETGVAVAMKGATP